MDRFALRRHRVARQLRKAGIDALLVTNDRNVTYLTGFTGDDSYLVLGHNETVLISDARFTTQIGEECPGVELHVRPTGTSILAAVAKVADSINPSQLAVEADSLTLAAHQELSSLLPQVRLIATSGLVERFREVKDTQEVAHIREAIRCAERAFAVLRASLRPERTEKELADDLERDMRRFGATGCSFPTIVAAGSRAALPHAAPGDRQIGDCDFVLVDWGATARGYRSDLTRVLATARISPKLERVYGVVLAAQKAGLAEIRAGVSASQVDAAARNVIAKAGFGRAFGHGLGHGIGLDIHEAPRMSAGNNRLLEAGMVLTVEPGIYLPGWGGVRIEDDVLVTKSGCEILTHVAKELDEIVAG